MKAPNITAAVTRSLEQEAQVLPHRSNWASDLGDPCLRKLVYYRKEWDKQRPPSARLQGIFNTGKKLERVVKNILNEIGREQKPQWELVDTGVAIKDDFLLRHQIGGVPDTFLKVWPEDKTIPQILGPVEIKGFEPNTFNRIEILDDMRRITWMRRYFAQLTIYELGSNFDMGWFLIFNKANLWEYRFLPLALDYGYAESLTKKADAVNEYLSNGELPAKLNRPDECCRCSFQAFCAPELQSMGNLKMMDDPELEDLLNRRYELQPYHQEYEAIEKTLKKQLIGGQELICGFNLITWKKIDANRKPDPGGPYSYWKKKIIRTDKCEDENDEE